jgi:uncharacterized delta-60 repeat protein
MKYIFPAAPRILAYTAFMGALVCLPLAAFAIPLDPAFGTGGKFTLDFASSGPRSSFPFWIYQQPSGRLVLAGRHGDPGPIVSNSAIAMCGITQSGGLDATFGSAGKVLEWNNLKDVVDLQMLSNGKFLRLESISNFPASTAALVRLNSDGSPDATFSANINVAGNQIRPWKIAIHPNGKIYALIGQYNGSSSFWLVRMNANGTRDSSFGNDGVQPINLNRIPRFALGGMQVLSDGRLLFGGTLNTNAQAVSGANVLWMARFDENGYLDRSFGTQGIARRGFSANVSVSKTIVQPDGKYLLIGSSRSASTESKLLMMRLTSRGRADVGFGTNGIVESNVASTTAMNNVGLGGAVLSDGRILVIGSTSLSQSSLTSFLVARFSASGILEDHISTQFTDGLSSSANDAIVQPDDKLVVTGYTRNPDSSASGDLFAAARYIP